MATVAKWSGREARALREARRMSVRAFAAHLGLAKGSVVNWERRGELARLRRETQEILDVDLNQASEDVRERFLAILACHSDTVLSIKDSAEVRERRRERRGASDPAPAPEPDALSELLPAGDLLTPLSARDGRRVGLATVRDLTARVHSFRLADDVLAGGDLIVPVFRDLRATLSLYRESPHTEVVGRGLLVQVGELAQIAGWIASDAGKHTLAERAYRLGASAARAAGDATLAANLVGSLAYQYANTRREQEAVDLAGAALDEAGADAPAQTRALFFDRLAWAHTRVGEPQQAIRAAGQAHDALSTAGDDAPQWAYWVSQDELTVMDARVFTELRRPPRAVPLLSTVLDRYDVTHRREMALYLSWLAIAYIDANEPEAAASTVARMLDQSGELASARATERTRIVAHRLREFADVPEVHALLAEHLLA